MFVINKLRMVIYGLCTLLLFPLWASEEINLTEASLHRFSREGSSDWQAVEADYSQSQSDALKSLDRFKADLFAGAQYAETREKPIISFIPVWTPSEELHLGVKQNLPYGMMLKGSVGVNQQSAMTPVSTYQDISTSFIRFDMQMDLWRDLFGKISKAEQQSAENSLKLSQFQKTVSQKAFEYGLRKMYWTLVANNEQIRISQLQLKTSEEQLKDAQARQRAGVTDSGEVARYEALVASRQGTVLYFQYQREALIKQLTMKIPSLYGKNISISGYNLDDTVFNVLSCTQAISEKKVLPYEDTLYDEMISLLRENKNFQEKSVSAYDEIDLTLNATARTTGVASESISSSYFRGSYGDSFDDWRNNNRTGYSLGLNLTIPFGRTETKKSLEILNEKRFAVQVDLQEARLKSTHEQIVKSILLLQDVVRAQNMNTKALEKRLFVQNKKFREARVSVNDLIQDQDALLGSSLNVISTQLEIVNTLFDYLVVFSETNCAFNKI
jgi:hypothetical protein